MIIAVNTRLLLKGRLEGIGRFSFEILKRITTTHKEHTFLFLFDRKFDPEFIFSDNIIPIVLFPPSRHPVLWYWFFEYSVTEALKKHHADIFITTDGWLSLRTKVKTLQVLHDLHFRNYPEFLPYSVKKYYQYYFPKFIQKASSIITVSNFCKNEIETAYSIDRNKIDVVYNSSREEYFPIPEEEKIKTRNKYTEGLPYFLFIGPVHPRKNLDRAIRAFLKFKNNCNEPMKLVVTGATMWKHYGHSEYLPKMKSGKEVVFTGYLEPEDLFKITASAECLLYVSFYEGFGMPILEAMSCNVPVITSDRSAMPETAGGASLLINPESEDSICDAMIQVQKNNELRQELILKGKKNLKRFSWDKSAEIFWESILKVLYNSQE